MNLFRYCPNQPNLNQRNSVIGIHCLKVQLPISLSNPSQIHFPMFEEKTEWFIGWFIDWSRGTVHVVELDSINGLCLKMKGERGDGGTVHQARHQLVQNVHGLQRSVAVERFRAVRSLREMQRARRHRPGPRRERRHHLQSNSRSLSKNPQKLIGTWRHRVITVTSS